MKVRGRTKASNKEGVGVKLNQKTKALPKKPAMEKVELEAQVFCQSEKKGGIKTGATYC